MRKLMLLSITAIIIAGTIVSCAGGARQVRIVTSSAEANAIIDSLQTRLRECEEIADQCCNNIEIITGESIHVHLPASAHHASESRAAVADRQDH